MSVRVLRKSGAVGVLAALLAFAGCDREEEGSEPEAPPLLDVSPVEEAVETSEEIVEEALEETAFVPDSLWFSTFPGRDEHQRVELMWLGGDERVSVREEPRRDSPVLVEKNWLDGEDLDWNQSRVHVLRPRTLSVARESEWVGIPFDQEFEELEAEPRSYRVEQGELLYLYQYDGEGQCYLGIDQEVALGDCPAEGALAVREILEDFLPEEQEWWIEILTEAGPGWLLVDEAPLEVRVLEISAPHHDSEYGADEM